MVVSAGCGDDAADPSGERDGAIGTDASGEPEPRDGGERDGGRDERDGAMPVRDSGYEPDAGAVDDAGAVADAGDAGEAPDAGAVDAGPPPLSLGGLTVDSDPKTQALDLFGTAGHRFWIEVNERQLALLNSGGGGGFPGEDDIYTPGSAATFADHILIQDANTGSVADYGKIEIDLVGESTYRQWDLAHIPNIRIDADEFQMGMRIGGFEHIRLNNSLVGTIFREYIAHRIYRELEYPALRASYAFLGSNVWGDGIWVPMTLIEAYKFRFCDDNAELLGGNCVNMWEFYGDVAGDGGHGGPFPLPGLEPIPFIDPGPRPPGPGPGPVPGLPPNACQVKECDNTRLEDLQYEVAGTPFGPGFKTALADFIEWDRFHEFQCLSWIMWVGDDPLHNSNNNLIIEREDGKLIWAPYSVDISAGQDWYQDVPLPGSSTLARGCQADPQCWADTIAACEELITRFDALDPETIVDETVDLLTELDMMRSGDEGRAADLREWFIWRQEVLASELERYRYLPGPNGECPEGYQLCGDGGCGTEEQCAERECPPGEMMCASLGRCTARFEHCPSCSEAAPVWCNLTQECTTSTEECHASCGDIPDHEYCEVFDQCVEIGSCPNYGDGGFPFPGGGMWGGGPVFPID